MAIELLSRLNNSGNDYRLTIIGNGPEMESLKFQVISLGLTKNVFFKGSLVGNQLADELYKHKYMLIPSKWKEPFGIVALEGISCGCIPIVSDGGGLLDAVGCAGINFKRGDLNDLFDKTTLLMNNYQLQKELYSAANFQLSKHYPNVIAKKYISVFNSIVK